MAIRFEPLGREHDREGFDCGIGSLNDYLRHTARQHQEKGVARTFVMVSPNDPATIIGYFTLSICEVRTDELPAKWSGRYPRIIGGVKLARLAVAVGLRKKGYGGVLVAEAITRTIVAGKQLGITAIFVDAINGEAASFYSHLGFIPLPDKMKLFLPLAGMGTVRD